MNNASLRKSAAGFTLLEILIALVIFAIIGILTTLSLHRIIGNNKALNKQDQRVMQLQMAITLIRRDLLQALNRPIIDSSGNQSVAFSGSGSELSFTRAGLVNPLGFARRSDMQRISYNLSDTALVRSTWTVLDQPAGAKPQRKKLIDHVNMLSWSFVDSENKKHDSWPPSSEGNQQAISPLPKAVLLTMSIKGEGEVDGVFPVPATGDMTTDAAKTNP